MGISHRKRLSVLPRWALINLDIVMQQLIPKGSRFQRHPHETCTPAALQQSGVGRRWPFKKGSSSESRLGGGGPVKCSTSHLYQVHYTYAVFCNRENFTVYKKMDIYRCTILVQCYLWKRKNKKKTCPTLLEKTLLISFLTRVTKTVFRSAVTFG